jgi:hypothetical protein
MFSSRAELLHADTQADMTDCHNIQIKQHEHHLICAQVEECFQIAESSRIT